MGEIYCAGPAPLLWRSLFLLIPMMFVFAFVLIVYIGIRCYRNKKSKKKILDKRLESYLILLAVTVASLITYGLVGLQFNLYLIWFFLSVMYLAISFIFCERRRIFKIPSRTKTTVGILLIFFAILFLVRWFDSFWQAHEKVKGVDAKCISQRYF